MHAQQRSLRSPPFKGGLLLVVLLVVLYSLVTVSTPRGTSLVPSLGDLKARLSAVGPTWNAGGGRSGGAQESQWAAANDGVNTSRRANAAFVILARNNEVWGVMDSMRSMEDRFNRKFNYPYIFLNDVPFSDEFMLRTSSLASGKCSYGIIPPSQFGDIPPWIDQDKMNDAIKEMSTHGIPYADSIPYRKMCRFQSGFFWRHPLLETFEYYWRIEPDVRFLCDLDYDPFLRMKDEGKSYGFTMSIFEFIETIPTLWDTTKNFMRKHPEFVASPNMMNFISDDGGETYNRLHFWSNFEIARLDFWRSPAYRAYFDFLDQAGGFFYERWGDAPVHSLAVSLFMKTEEVLFFQDIGYRHSPYQHCPQESPGRCNCNPNDSFETDGYSGTPQWKKATGWTGTY